MNNISSRKFIAISLIISLFASMLTGCLSTKASRSSSSSCECFDTIITLTINNCSGEESAEDIINECFGLCHNYEKIFSRTRDDSDVFKINSAGGTAVEVKQTVADLINDSIYYGNLTNGAFDITVGPLSELWNFTSNTPCVPSDDEIQSYLPYLNYKNISVNESFVQLADNQTKIDLGGIVKGFVADSIKSYMIQMGVTSAIINLGGNIVMVGDKGSDGDFNIGIQKPFGTSEEYSVIVKGADLSIVTSGIYERYFKVDDIIYHHILNPKTGYPVKNNLYSVTIISEQSELGDALSTSCYVLGLKKGMKLIESLPEAEAVFIDKNNKIHLSSGLEIIDESDDVPTISLTESVDLNVDNE